MSKGFNGLVYTDVPPMENVVLLASSFPTAAPSRAVPNRADCQFVVDMEGCISLTHNATNTPAPLFTMLKWSDPCGYWIQAPSQGCAQFGEIIWKVFANTPIYIFSSVALTGGGAVVAIGGVTIQGNLPVITSGV